ncbi:ATP-binding protein [Methylonatrum kenyense]|uniref:sensor histidine kinase n=1 Tax=Methylonatrum kenyense TaxID=455253 RepID=UPI0020BEF7AF|nr:sensor histidine kinase [Methylonatrum kenyense]MCK8515942.1 ATP-binding protein [Methylonatrum kenyense]
MQLDLTTLSISAILYLLLLFLIAHAAEKRWLPGKLVRHPAVYVLSLGVYATSWSYYGSVGFAEQQGLLFLTIYLGVTLAFVLTPVLLMPILRLTRTYQLSSVADLFAFRFNSQPVGILVTLLMLAGVLPYIALQIRAVTESTVVLSQDSSPQVLALWFVIIVSLFAIIFGARHVTPREKHEGMVVAIAFESVMKLFALLLVAGVAVYQAFGGPAGLQQHLVENPQLIEDLYGPARQGAWPSLLVLAFAAGFLLPRQFHMLFTENIRSRHLYTASWAFPLYLLALTLVIPPILWSAQVLQPATSPDYHVLGLSMASGSPTLAIIAYLGGISAASAMIVVSTLAISSMAMNHLLLPLAGVQPQNDLYGALRWTRRALIVAVITAGYIFYLLMEAGTGLVGWGLISFLAMAQLLPGILGLLFWPRATAGGFIAGLLAGATVWSLTALLPPLTGDSGPAWFGLGAAGAAGSPEMYQSATFWSLSVNAILFVLVSLCSRQSNAERDAASACRELTPAFPVGDLRAASPHQFVERLASVMGRNTASAEVERALRDLAMDWNENRPGALHDLRIRIQRNLSGMMGPVLARMIVDHRLELEQEDPTTRAQNVRLVEDRLETSRTRLRGLAAELDRLRRYHRQIIEDLPVGVCALAHGNRLVRWNPAIARLTGIALSDVIGRRLEELPPPWGKLLSEFLNDGKTHWHRQQVEESGRSRWYSLHKASIEEPGHGRSGDTVLLIEDFTDLQVLEKELAHSERLASIGRLAAGVAHEIGNPVTGITCLAQELRDQPDPAQVQECAEDILHQAQRINNIVQSLVRYAHGGSPMSAGTLEAVNLHDTVAEATRLTMLSRRARNLRFDNRVPVDLEVEAKPQPLVQVFVNLFTNAADACQDRTDGRVSVSAEHRGAQVRIRVRDNGCGIEQQSIARVLEPFYTTKQPGHGTGLGLPLVYNIIRDCGGALEIDSDTAGTAVTLTLKTASVRQIEEA